MSELSTNNASKSITKYIMAVSLGVLSLLSCVACGYKDIATEDAHLEQTEVTVTKQGYLTPEQVIANLKYPVNDFTDTLTLYEREQLSAKLRALHDPGVVQAGVVIVETTDGMSLFEYAMQVAEGWELGSADSNDGLLIVMAVADRQIYILTGLGIEERLTDEKVAQVINTVITPHFKQEQYVQGLSKGIDALVKRLTS